MKKSVLLFIIIITGVSSLHSLTIVLANGDRIKATSYEELPETKEYVVDSELLGRVTLSIDSVKEIIEDSVEVADSKQPQKEAVLSNKEPVVTDTRKVGEILWKNHLALGFSYNGGNLDLINVRGGLKINRNRRWIDEWTLKAGFDRRADTGVVTLSQLDAELRYGFSISKKFYGYLQLYSRTDSPSQLMAQLRPTVGLGYWIFDIPKPELKLMFELGGGYDYNSFTDDTWSGDGILQVRGIFYWDFAKNLSFKQDFYYYPTFTSLTNFSIKSISTFTLHFNKKFAFKLYFNLDYKSVPATGVKPLDTAFSAGLDWKF